MSARTVWKVEYDPTPIELDDYRTRQQKLKSAITPDIWRVHGGMIQ